MLLLLQLSKFAAVAVVNVAAVVNVVAVISVAAVQLSLLLQFE